LIYLAVRKEKDLISMVTNQINSNANTVGIVCKQCGHHGLIKIPTVKHGVDFETDMAYGQPLMILTTPEDDMKKNIDLSIRELKVAYRTRDLKISKYKEISIRNERKSGAKTEKEKILNGECKALLYIFDFKDCFILCKLSDIFDCLLKDIGHMVPNHDQKTSGYYINIGDIPHMLIEKKP